MKVWETKKRWRKLFLSITCSFFLIHAVTAGEPFTKMPVDSGGSYFSIGPSGLKKILEKKDFLFINVHVPYEGEIKSTDLFIPYTEIRENMHKLPPEKNTKIIIYCRTDRMSIIAARTLVELGYSNVWSLEGGMEAWEKAGLSLLEKRVTP